MESMKIYKSKVDWWVYAVCIGTVVICMVGPMFDGDYIAGIILSAVMLVIEVFCFTGVRYAIKGNMLGVRNLHHWTWIPIDKITEVKKTRGIIATAAMSLDRVSIRFSDRKVLKSAMPIEISPKDRDGFIADLKKINPEIVDA